MKLYVLQPREHGPKSYFVMAESEAEARESIFNFIKEYPDIWYPDYWTKTHSIKAYECGQVIENDND